MKKIIYSFVLSLGILLSAQAQIDRSIQPKPGPSPQINLGKPQSFKLPNGLTVLVVENHKLPRVSFTLSLDNPPVFEGNLAGISEITGTMMGNGTSKISKDEFNEQIEFYGASVNFGVSGVRGSVLSRYFSNVLSLAMQGALDPLFAQEELDSERSKAIDGLKIEEKSASAIAKRVSDALVYGRSHPFGEFVTEASLNSITLDNVKDFYRKNFVPNNAYLVIVGDIKFDEAKKLVTKELFSWKKGVLKKEVHKDPANLTTTEINFVDVPSAVQSEIYVLNVTQLKMTDTDYYAVLLANMLLGGGADGYLYKNLRETHGWTYGAYSSIKGDKYVSDFSASASVRNAVTDSAVVELLNEIKRLRTNLPTQEDLKLAKAKYIGSFVMNAEKPQTIAGFALNERTQNLPDSFYANYIKNINAVTLEDVRSAAAKYILGDGVRIVVVGKASEVLPKLEGLGIPVKYFDKEASPIAKPQVEEGITAQSVLDDYIKAVGGKEALSKIKTIMTTSAGSVQGQDVTIVQKITTDRKSLQEMTIAGVPMKIVYDGTQGYVSVFGNKKPFETAELEQMKYTAPFPELLLLDSDISFSGIEDNAYVLTIKDRTFYYDKDTHLKLAESITVEAEGNKAVQKIEYGDYKEFNGIKMPTTTYLNNMGVNVKVTVSDVKFNEGVSDTDFN